MNPLNDGPVTAIPFEAALAALDYVGYCIQLSKHEPIGREAYAMPLEREPGTAYCGNAVPSIVEINIFDRVCSGHPEDFAEVHIQNSVRWQTVMGISMNGVSCFCD